ncbi:MAG: hypothetical protein MJA84_03640 [Firmicutes bacterium]|nr:hypothetical protein [Bacillota bacterium]
MNIQFINFLVEFITRAIPECISLTIFITAILRLKIDWKKTIIIGTIVAFGVLVFRWLILSTGLHTAASIITLALLFASFYKVPKFKSLIASIIGMLFLGTIELISFAFFKLAYNLDIHQLAQNKLLWDLSLWINIVVLLFSSYIIYRTKWYGRNISRIQ